VALRRHGRELREAFIQDLCREERDRLELKLADVLEPLLAKSRVAGGYAPLPHEISPIPALNAAAARGVLISYPAFADHQSHFRFLAGDPIETGPWSVLQPALDSPHVFPDLVLMPWSRSTGAATGSARARAITTAWPASCANMARC
jgi:5-formyltetrahydrofolate cyclo-ligase